MKGTLTLFQIQNELHLKKTDVALKSLGTKN